MMPPKIDYNDIEKIIHDHMDESQRYMDQNKELPGYSGAFHYYLDRKNIAGQILKLIQESLKNQYNEEIPDYADIMRVDEFKVYCDCGSFIDYDGFGHPVKDGKMSGEVIFPSNRNEIPNDATHIAWFNR